MVLSPSSLDKSANIFDGFIIGFNSGSGYLLGLAYGDV